MIVIGLVLVGASVFKVEDAERNAWKRREKEWWRLANDNGEEEGPRSQKREET